MLLKIKDEIIDTAFRDCWNLGVTEIISIPYDVKNLWCNNNQLTFLPELPKNLEGLFCHINKIKQLPNLIEFNNLKEVSCDIQCFEPYMLEMKNTHFYFYC